MKREDKIRQVYPIESTQNLQENLEVQEAEFNKSEGYDKKSDDSNQLKKMLLWSTLFLGRPGDDKKDKSMAIGDEETKDASKHDLSSRDYFLFGKNEDNLLDFAGVSFQTKFENMQKAKRKDDALLQFQIEGVKKSRGEAIIRISEKDMREASRRGENLEASAA